LASRVFLTAMASASIDMPRHGWVLYDGSCGLCSRLASHWENVLKRNGFHTDVLQAGWVSQKLQLPYDELVADIRLLLVNGEQRQGAEVYRYVMRRIWWARPVYFASTLPVLRSIFDGAYRRFADNRYRVSRTCRMPARDITTSK
jgi:predicted DCC family thiol-disulfide oxidoreductase YuxK